MSFCFIWKTSLHFLGITKISYVTVRYPFGIIKKKTPLNQFFLTWVNIFNKSKYLHARSLNYFKYILSIWLYFLKYCIASPESVSDFPSMSLPPGFNAL